MLSYSDEQAGLALSALGWQAVNLLTSISKGQAGDTPIVNIKSLVTRKADF